jgi:hypothetical protein
MFGPHTKNGHFKRSKSNTTRMETSWELTTGKTEIETAGRCVCDDLKVLKEETGRNYQWIGKLGVTCLKKLKLTKGCSVTI